jgi:hypothetical protein
VPNTEPLASNPSSRSEVSPSVSSRHRDDDAARPEERIRRRAYELYVERGSEPGDGVEDWLRAEREYYEQP